MITNKSKLKFIDKFEYEFPVSNKNINYLFKVNLLSGDGIVTVINGTHKDESYDLNISNVKIDKGYVVSFDFELKKYINDKLYGKYHVCNDICAIHYTGKILHNIFYYQK